MADTDSVKPPGSQLAPQLRFSNRFADALPADPEFGSRRRQLHNACYSRVTPAQVAAPQLVAYSSNMAERLSFSEEFCTSPAFTQVFSGNRLLPGMDPHASCYGGHQFGNWAGQLGDGRAINLGEVQTDSGEYWMLQLKGAGPTPYSRTADGLAVLRSSVREFLCSEAMFHLGVPTTRALSLITTGEQVLRDILYDGNPAPEPGAVVCRTAPSFTRFGHFEILAARGETDLLRRLLDVTIRCDFPHLLGSQDTSEVSTSTHLAWFREVCQRTLDMVIHWQRVGFVHGVMNTDNMSILGLTIDYGPYGWLEDFDPEWTPNTTDAANRRYRYGQQPAIAQWNLLQLANAVFPVIAESAELEAALTGFSKDYAVRSHQMQLAKLGLTKPPSQAGQSLVQELTSLLQMRETDMTLFYRCLAEIDAGVDSDQRSTLEPAYYPNPADNTAVPPQQQALAQWLGQYITLLRVEGLPQAQRRAQMNAINPLYVPRNYLAQLAIDKAEQGDYSGVNDWLQVLKNPYADQAGKDHYAQRRPDWARTRVGCSMLSCSS